MEMILHGQRIATNGDVRLMPTPEQWDLVATLKGRHADKANNRLTADLAFPTFDLSYTLEVAAEPGGVKVSINLDKPLPEKLAGRAGFNLEFLPSIYMGKAYLVDGTKAGIFPRTPNDPMVKVLPLADEPKKAYYLEDWDKAKGYTQPLPFAEGKSITLGVDDALARVNVKSDTADLMLFDGRDRAQNGWFVLRSLIPSGKTTGAIVWHIRPDVIPNWTRPPMIAHSQVGYAPDFSKVAVLELDPKYDGPKTAKGAAPDGGRIVQAGVRGSDHAFDALAALRLFEIRLHPGQGPRPLCHRVCRPAYGALPHLQRRLRQHLAGQPGPSPCGADGSRFRSRRLPRVARRFAPG
jgi:endoglucanase